MRYTEIDYVVNGNKHIDVVREKEGWEKNYEQNIIDRIEAITNARDSKGRRKAVVVGIRQYK